MNNEWRSEKSQGMKKVTTIIMNKKMSVVTTLQLFLTYVSVHTDVLILPCADSCLEQPACHTIAKYWSTQQPLWLLSTHTLHTPTLTCTHLSRVYWPRGRAPYVHPCYKLTYTHTHTANITTPTVTLVIPQALVSHSLLAPGVHQSAL